MTRTQDRFSFGRDDGVALTILLILIALGTTIFSLALPVADWIRGEQLIVPYQSDVHVPQLDSVHIEHSAGSYVLYLDDPSTVQRLLDLVPSVLTWCGVLVIGRLVLRVMRPIVAGEPFASGQVSRLRALAVLVGIGPAVILFVTSFCRVALLAQVDLGGLPVVTTSELPWASILAGMVLALLAEAFREGARLREDTEGLI